MASHCRNRCVLEADRGRIRPLFSVVSPLAFLTLLGVGGCGGGDAHESVPSPAVSTRVDASPANGAETEDRLSSTGAERVERPTLTYVSEIAVDSGDRLGDALSRGSAQVRVLYVPADGWSYRTESGSLTGVTVELLRDFFEWAEATQGIQIEVVWDAEDDWARFYRRVRNASGGVFGIGNVTITDVRRTELDFSAPYLSNVAVLVTHAQVPELTSMADAVLAFASFTAHPYRGTLHEERINRLRERRIPGLRVIPLDSNDEILSRITEDTRSLAWIDAPAFFRALEQGLPVRRHPVGDDASESFGVILPQGSDWTPLLTAFLEEGPGYPNLPRFTSLLEAHLGPGLAALLKESRAGRIPKAPAGQPGPDAPES
jgi:hypothetical protein